SLHCRDRATDSNLEQVLTDVQLLARCRRPIPGSEKPPPPSSSPVLEPRPHPSKKFPRTTGTLEDGPHTRVQNFSSVCTPEKRGWILSCFTEEEDDDEDDSGIDRERDFMNVYSLSRNLRPSQLLVRPGSCTLRSAVSTKLLLGGRTEKKKSGQEKQKHTKTPKHGPSGSHAEKFPSSCYWHQDARSCVGAGIHRLRAGGNLPLLLLLLLGGLRGCASVRGRVPVDQRLRSTRSRSWKHIVRSPASSLRLLSSTVGSIHSHNLDPQRLRRLCTGTHRGRWRRHRGTVRAQQRRAWVLCPKRVQALDGLTTRGPRRGTGTPPPPIPGPRGVSVGAPGPGPRVRVPPPQLRPTLEMREEEKVSGLHLGSVQSKGQRWPGLPRPPPVQKGNGR
ncbi:unnamed protein product, partial [Pleuronectes platessa]